MTPVDETISNVVDWENGSNACVYVKSEDCFFVGHVKTVGDGKGDGWICLSTPIKYDITGNELYSHEDDEGAYITIPLSDVRYIEIFN